MKWFFFIFLIFTAIIYGSFLNRIPVHFNQDELGFSLNAYLIAKTGLDESGRFFPLYFWHLNIMWATPFIVYLTAIFLKFLPLSETVIRLPSVLVGCVDILLIFILARKIFKSEFWGLLAAILLAITPVHFIHSRLLLDNLYIVPFVLLWLIFLFQFEKTKKYQWLVFASLTLGMGVHSYHAGKIMMPFFLLLTLFFLRNEIDRDQKVAKTLVATFVLSLLPFVPWWITHPDTIFSDQAKYTGITQTSLLSPESLFHRLDVYINYFNPVFLFLKGDESLIHTTGRSGVFLASIAVFLLVGICRVLKYEKSWYSRLLIVGFFTAPLAATIVGDHYRISRALVILPFAVLISVYSIQYLLAQKNILLRIICFLLLVAIPIQFAYFYYDYLKDYRIRSYTWFRYNIPDALEAVIKQNTYKSLNQIYLDKRVDFIDRYWRFFLIKNNQEDLLEKTAYFDPNFAKPSDFSDNSLLLFHFDHISGQTSELESFKKIDTIYEPDGTSRFYIFRN